MQVRKRSGDLEEVNPEKILNSVKRTSDEIEGVDYWKIVTKTLGGLYDGVSTKELDQLSIRTAVGLITEEPIYSKVAALMLSNFIRKEVENQEIYSFSQSVQTMYDQGLTSEETYNFVMENKRKLNNAIKEENNKLFDYFGLSIYYDRYLLKHPETRMVIETPQYSFMRVAVGLSDNAKEAILFYNLLSSLEYMTSSPTLFNSGTHKTQLSSCYLLDSPEDSLEGIYKSYADVAKLSKWAGGIGISWSRVREDGKLIKGTNGPSNGLIPWLNVFDASVAAVNQGGRRRGSACVYLESWHPDIMEFLALRDQGGDHERRAHNLNLANWIPDLFMKRLEKQAALKKAGSDETVMWSLISPNTNPELVDLFGEEFEKRYEEIEAEGGYKRQVPINLVWERMLRTLAQSGQGWICFKDTSNKRCNSAVDGNVCHLSNLCLTPDTTIHAWVEGVETEMSIDMLSSLFREGQYIRVKSYNEKTNEFEWQDVINAGITSYDEEVIQIETESGKVLECTENHLIYTQNRGWVKAGELIETDELLEQEINPVHRLEMWKMHKLINNSGLQAT